VTDAAGTVISQQYYKAWGETRYTSGSEQTRYQYTGQYSHAADFGLMFYNARWYDPTLGRFAQADTIVPGGVQGYDRYAYVNNAPTRFTDPSGHKCVPEDECEGYKAGSGLSSIGILKTLIKKEFGIVMSDKGGKNWDTKNLQVVRSSLQNIDSVLNGNLKSIVRGATWTMREHNSVNGTQYYGETSGTNVVFETVGTQAIRQMNIYHEFGHVIDNSPGMVDVFSNALGGLDNPGFVNDAEILDSKAFINLRVADSNHVTAKAIQHQDIGPIEQWADIFANHIAGNINLTSSDGREMNRFVTGVLDPYINNSLLRWDN
jgi:RHS repeat-associated protein